MLGMTRRAATVVALAALTVTTALAAGAAQLADEEWAPSAGGWSSGPLTYVDSLPFEVGTAGGMDLRGDLLVATSWTSFSLFDVSDPLAPEHLETVPLGFHFINERPQLGDGWLAINDDFSRTLRIYDVSDPTAPDELATLTWPDTRRHHQWTCVLDCAHLYSNAGAIVSMADAGAPEVVGDWYAALDGPPRDTHGIAEVAPGLVLTGTLPVHLLDATDDPTSPRLVVTEDVRTTSADAPYVVLGPPPESFAADLAWPLEGSGDFALISKETPFSGECTEESGEVLSVDMRQAFDEDEPRMTVVDGYQITENGLPSDGLAPANVIGCSPYVMGVHPGFDDTGLAAVAFMEHGVRLLTLDDDGTLAEVGGFIPHGGASAAPLWVNDEVLYVLDFTRGIDMLRLEP
jgi:hypothetical protein